MAVGDTNCRVICGDCRDLLPDVVAGVENPVIVTDPPFNVGYHYSGFNDRSDERDYWDLMAWVFTQAPSVVVLYPEALHRLSVELGRVPDRVVSWVYPSNTRRQHRDIGFYGVEPDFSLVRQPYRNPNDKRIQALIAKGSKGAKSYDWIQADQVKNVSREKTAHPCQMPVKVMELAVGVLGPDVTVVDPFCGSGTTGVACVRGGVPFVGIELVPEYAGIAMGRIDGVLIEESA